MDNLLQILRTGVTKMYTVRYMNEFQSDDMLSFNTVA